MDAQCLADIDAAYLQVVELRVVQVAARDRLLEDRRIGGDADNAAVADQLGQIAGGDPVAAQVVEPDRDAGLADQA